MPNAPQSFHPFGYIPPRPRPTQQPPTYRKLYGRKWRNAKAKYLAAYPLCNACASRRIRTKADTVDHIVPHKGDEKLFWSRSNWQALCRACHNSKTASKDGGFGHGCSKIQHCANGLPHPRAGQISGG